MHSIVAATRKTTLALAQTELVKEYLKQFGFNLSFLELSTTGDRQQNWSLEKEGGKGLFTKELEDAILNGAAHIAVHSAKDLPTDLPKGLCIAGYLPRGNARDVLVSSCSIEDISTIATGSPRRRAQIKKRLPQPITFHELRGRVETRLDKIAGGAADATILAGAGLDRLHISSWKALNFTALSVKEMVPAVGQGAIAIESTVEFSQILKPILCQKTYKSVTFEREFLAALGGGCQVAYAAYHENDRFHIFHEKIGYREFDLEEDAEFDIVSVVQLIQS